MMRMRTAGACWAVLGVVASVGANPASAEGLEELYRLRDARTLRSSSADPNWQNGNGDCRPIEPGGTLTVAELQGPGIIRHIWFTIAADDPQYGRSLTLRMYWDGREQPAVESPIGDFFAVGHGAMKTVNSMPVAVTSDGRAYNCYWPMPFGKSARITLSNDSKKHRVGCVFWYVDYERVDRLSEQTAYFHAQYRQEYPTKMGEDYLILDAEGRGHYVGTVLSAVLRTPGWFGEGDDRFFIDGESEPSLRGTGTEDYFCDAWGFRTLDRPYYGVTLLEGFDVGDKLTVYRWHVADPVHFRKSLKVTIEHKGVMVNTKNEMISGFTEREDMFSSVAFWYQTGEAKRFTELPPAEARVVPRWMLQMETLVEGARPTPEDTGKMAQPGNFSGGSQLFVTFLAPNGELVAPFEVKKAVRGLGRLTVTRSWDFGIWEISLDGKVLPGMEALDLYSPNVVTHEWRVGNLELAPGKHELRFRNKGKNGASRGYFLGMDMLTVDEIEPYLKE